MKIATELHRPKWVSLPQIDAILRDDVLMLLITPQEFPTDPNYCRATTVSASPFIRKNATLENVSRLCLNLTDYQTFKTDFLRPVEFSQWVRENYPDKVPLN